MAKIKVSGGVKVSGQVRAKRFNDPPAWDTIAGSLGTPFEIQAFTVTPGATDPDSFPSGGDVDYSITSGSLPSGLSLNAETGEVSGTPDAVGSDTLSNFTLRAEDGPIGANLPGKGVERDFTITVIDDNPPNVSPAAGNIGSVAELTAASLIQITATDPNTITQSITFSEVGANLTTENLSIDSNGNITGTPPDSGGTRTLNFTVRASTATNSTDVAYSITITDNQDPVWVTAAGLLATVNESEAITTITLAATDDNAVSYSVTAGALPGGLSLNSSTGDITGTPDNVAEDTTSSFTVRATDTVESDFTDRCFTIKVLNVIANSLRLNKVDSAGLRQTLVAGDSSRKMTFSTWAKRANLGSATNGFTFLSAQRAAASNGFYIEFEDTDSFIVVDRNSGGTINLLKRTNALFRDPSAWYHIVVIIDTTDATAEDRVKIFINGVRITSFTTATNYSLNEDLAFLNTAQVHDIGGRNDSTLNAGEGYLSEHYFIDGLALAATDFGAFDTNGDWQPKEYSGAFGTNGWHLDFAVAPGTGNGGGTDVSGNGNHWTDSGLAANDQISDSPTSSSSNYCVINPLDALTTDTPIISNGNLEHSRVTGVGVSNFATFYTQGTGKWYFEVEYDTLDSATGHPLISFMKLSTTTRDFGLGVESSGGFLYRSVSGNTASYVTVTAGDIFMFAVDYDANKAWLGKNGTWVNGGDPALGTNADETAFPAESHRIEIRDRNNSISKLDFGQLGYTHTPPTGFLSLNSANLSIPTIADPSDHFSTKLYTGNATASTGITGAGFQPDLVWIKNRSQADEHKLIDSVRGATKELNSDSTNNESTDANGLTAFNAGGFTLGTGANGYNDTGESFVAWCWNESATPGFDIVSYVGDGAAGHNISHSLGAIPAMMIVKDLNEPTSTDWRVYHQSNTSAPETDELALNTTAATLDVLEIWNDTSPISTQFTVGTNASVNANTFNYIAYLWAEIEGFSKFGGYTGNASADGPFVWCGFRPAWLMIKRTDTTEDWFIGDVLRDIDNQVANTLSPNLTSVEGTGFNLDFLSNGFKIRGTSANFNASGGTYIFAVFAESPFKTARAR